ncbi:MULTISPECIES: MFS transporter [Micromonospora]|uniref:MFS-type transporter involved in bile tolerance, Atg22 family n=1 Tax=Micromonospora yangpuensis TaxID=683228 RepID=A0A1C6V5L2_9ACTN|nr:MFS transporter [Micromonospora yangpuensis]GGM18497.1 MFS transporter [Micromonospora yangpuensis]SCL61565.1 MFS-type transporter involved in bile tolerance, Atg22 family [Micromonospora yangpuensis]
MSDERPAEERAATFGEVFSQREYRAVLSATTLAWVGDYIAKAAVTVLVYRESESVALSAAAFAVSFLPWLIGGPLLATIAERYRYRQVMVTCDLIRMALVSLVAIPGMPVWTILCLLFLTTLANPPSQAARSALMPLILTGDRLVVGLSINASVGQAAQVVGYLLGAAIATVNPTLALLVNATTFALSAVLVRLGVRDRPPAMNAAHRSDLLRETGEGFRIVFGNPALRAIAVLVFSSMLFAIVPEGLAAAWARTGSSGGLDAGVAQAVIMAANPVGFILGGLLIGRTVTPARRVRLIRPMAVIAPLVLVPALLDPPPLAVALLAAGCGFAVGGLLPVANGLFVRALPDGFRARAFGVMATGLQVIQGVAVLTTGLLAERFSIPLVVGLWSAAGVLLMLLVVANLPTHLWNASLAARGPTGAAPPAAEVDGSVPPRPRSADPTAADAPTR